MAELVVLQLMLPLVLLGWLWVRPLASSLARRAQAAAVGFVLLALHLAGLWLMPPWWMPWVYWALFGGALVAARRSPPLRSRPRNFAGWATTLLLVAIAGCAGLGAVHAWLGKLEPREKTVNLLFPFHTGTYLVANGGTNTLVSSHARTLARSTAKQRQYYGQSHGVDLVRVNRLGLQSESFNPRDPTRYHIFGDPVLAPCSGVIVLAESQKPDMRVPIMDTANMLGNHVLLRCRNVDVILAHFKEKSLRVNVGQHVSAGDVLAEAGNSGNSGAPHLHIHAQTAGPPDAPISGQPIPMRFDGRYLVRSDRVRKKGN